jgi:hypothetical protein
VKLGEGLVGYAALHKEVVLVPDVTKDPRYIAAFPECDRSWWCRCLLEGSMHRRFRPREPGGDAFNKKHVKLLTLLASEAAVAIENARLYESIEPTRPLSKKELRLAQRVQMALPAAGAAEAVARRDVAWHFDPARELGGDICDFLSPKRTRWSWSSATCREKASRRRSTARRSAKWCAGRTFRRRLEKNVTTPARFSPA